MGDYVKARMALDEIAKSALVQSAASALVQKGKKSKDFPEAFKTMQAAVAPFKKSGQRITIIGMDGSYLFSDGDAETFETVKLVENHMSRAEFLWARNHYYGDKVTKFDDEEKKRIPKALRKMMVKGYGFDQRCSSTTGNVENYAAKAIIETKTFPNQQNLLVRVSNYKN